MKKVSTYKEYIDWLKQISKEKDNPNFEFPQELEERSFLFSSYFEFISNNPSFNTELILNEFTIPEINYLLTKNLSIFGYRSDIFYIITILESCADVLNINNFHHESLSKMIIQTIIERVEFRYRSHRLDLPNIAEPEKTWRIFLSKLEPYQIKYIKNLIATVLLKMSPRNEYLLGFNVFPQTAFPAFLDIFPDFINQVLSELPTSESSWLINSLITKSTEAAREMLRTYPQMLAVCFKTFAEPICYCNEYSPSDAKDFFLVLKRFVKFISKLDFNDFPREIQLEIQNLINKLVEKLTSPLYKSKRKVTIRLMYLFIGLVNFNFSWSNNTLSFFLKYFKNLIPDGLSSMLVNDKDLRDEIGLKLTSNLIVNLTIEQITNLLNLNSTLYTKKENWIELDVNEMFNNNKIKNLIKDKLFLVKTEIKENFFQALKDYLYLRRPKNIITRTKRLLGVESNYFYSQDVDLIAVYKKIVSFEKFSIQEKAEVISYIEYFYEVIPNQPDKILKEFPGIEEKLACLLNEKVEMLQEEILVEDFITELHLKSHPENKLVENVTFTTTTNNKPENTDLVKSANKTVQFNLF